MQDMFLNYGSSCFFFFLVCIFIWPVFWIEDHSIKVFISLISVLLVMLSFFKNLFVHLIDVLYFSSRLTFLDYDKNIILITYLLLPTTKDKVWELLLCLLHTFICEMINLSWNLLKERPFFSIQNPKILQLLRGVAPQTPQRGVAPAPDQGPTGPWTPVQDFQFSNVRPMISMWNLAYFVGSQCL